MSIPMMLLALLEEGPSHGFGLKSAIESRTAAVWPINVGQIYTTLGRLERDELVRSKRLKASQHQPLYEITARGRTRLASWMASPSDGQPQRDELVLKVVVASSRGSAEARQVITREHAVVEARRRALVASRAGAVRDGDMPAVLLFDALIFDAEARIRWLETCIARYTHTASSTQPRPAKEPATTTGPPPTPAQEPKQRRRLLRRRDR